MRLIRVDLPLPVLPTIAVVWPGSGTERDRVEDRVLGARVAELDVVELDDAARAPAIAIGSSGSTRVASVSRTCLDPLGRRRGARDHHEHDRGHEDREQDLHDVGEERGQVADRQVAVVHLDAAEPHDRDRRQVEDQHDRREHQGEQPGDPEGRVGQVPVGLVEAALLVLGPDEGADDPDAAEGLAHDLVDPVDLDLDRPEQRQGARQHQPR